MVFLLRHQYQLLLFEGLISTLQGLLKVPKFLG